MGPSIRPSLVVLVALLGSLAAPSSFGAGDLPAAIELYRARNYTEAEKTLAELMTANPDDPEVSYYAGLVARRQKRLDQAIKWLEQAVRLAPQNSEYHVGLGDAYGALASKNRSFTLASRARNALEKAVALDPRSEKARAALIDYCREAPAIAGGGMGKAYAQAKEYRALEPISGTRLLAALYAHEKRYEDAIAVCRETLREHPGDYSILYQLGRFAAMTGTHLDEGRAALEKCLTLPVPQGFPGHTHAHVRLGQLAEKQADLAAAKEHFESAIALDATNAEAKDGLARLGNP